MPLARYADRLRAEASSVDELRLVRGLIEQLFDLTDQPEPES